MKIGIYGGSFDPVHVGHLLLAECCREELGLDEVWFVPAHQAPHKLGRQTTATEHRYQMLLLATVGNTGFRVSSLEIDRQGTSYTVDTLEHIHATKPQAELYLLMGADTFQDLPNWRSPNRVCELAAPVVVHRRGQTPPDIAPILLAGNVQINARCVPMPLIELSSTELRERVATAQSIRYRTSAAVEQYITQHELYQGK